MDVKEDTAFLQSVLSMHHSKDWNTLRKKALKQIRISPLPSSDQEDWKYLDLSPIYSQTFFHSKHSEPLHQPLELHLAAETIHSRLVFVNGQMDSQLSDTSALDRAIRFSVIAGSEKETPMVSDTKLRSNDIERETPKFFNRGQSPHLKNLRVPLSRHLIPGCNPLIAPWYENLGKMARPESSDMFANINTACFEDGVLVYIPRGRSVEVPLHLVYHSIGTKTTKPPIYFPRILVVLEPGAKAQLIEEYSGNGKYLTNSVVEIILGEGAYLKHDRIQRESMEAFHFCTLHADIARSASYSSNSISLGAAISRHNPTAMLAGAFAELQINGLSMLNTFQVADTHSLIDHIVQDCSSRQLHKFILDESAHGIFNGRVMVRHGAQRTDASQSSRTILLAQGARIDTKPQLEILTDDIKCSHGATVGQLDAEELFYLQSRGLDLFTARNLLLIGFAADVINNVSTPSLRQSLLRHVLAPTHTSQS